MQSVAGFGGRKASALVQAGAADPASGAVVEGVCSVHLTCVDCELDGTNEVTLGLPFTSQQVLVAVTSQNPSGRMQSTTVALEETIVHVVTPTRNDSMLQGRIHHTFKARGVVYDNAIDSSKDVSGYSVLYDGADTRGERSGR